MNIVDQTDAFDIIHNPHTDREVLVSEFTQHLMAEIKTQEEYDERRRCHLEREISALGERNSDLQDEINDLEEQIEREKEEVLDARHFLEIAEDKADEAMRGLNLITSKLRSLYEENS